MGEFARSSAIARALIERWPSAAVHFVLSRAAPYAAAAPFATTLLPSSPTFHSPEVTDVIRRFRPQVVIFDNAGRSAQIRAARALGARVIYISARRRQRRKAFRLSWMRLLDEHWIAYPEFIAGGLGFWERMKLKLLNRPTLRYLDVIMARSAQAAAAGHSVRQARGAYVLVIPGGGTGHPGAEHATEAFRRAAMTIARAGHETRFVGPPNAEKAEPPPPNFRATGALPQVELVDLMQGARLIVANGGSTLLQAIACGAAAVAAPIAGDQPERIRRCVAVGAAVEATLDPVDIAAKAGALLDDPQALEALAGRAAGLALADGVKVALEALAPFMDA